MKVHLVKQITVKDFCARHPQSKEVFADWLGKIRTVDWTKPGDIGRSFSSADLLGNGSQRVVFDIGGGNYRIICAYAFGVHKVHLFICWIGSHAEYDKINKAGKQYTVKIF